jgi:hypothetical protein
MTKRDWTKTNTGARVKKLLPLTPPPLGITHMSAVDSFAIHLGVSSQTVRNWLSGATVPMRLYRRKLEELEAKHG